LAFSGIVGTAFLAHFFTSKKKIASIQIENIDTKEARLDVKEESKYIHSSSVDSESNSKTDTYTSSQNETLQNTVDANEIRNNTKSNQNANAKSEIKKQKTSKENNAKIIKADASLVQNKKSGLGFGASRSFNSTNSDLSPGNSLTIKNPTLIHQPNSAKKLVGLANDAENTIGVQARFLPSLSTLLLSENFKKSLPRLATSNNDIEVDKPKKFSWQFSLLGGANNFLFKYSTVESSALATQKNESDTGQWGYQFGFQTTLVFNKQWVISSGLNYQNLYSRFDLVRQINTQVLQEDVILQVLVDGNTGEILNSILGDTLVNAMTTRTIVHHNRYQQFSIPLDFGFQKTHRSFIYGMQTGIGFHFVTTQSGKTLDLDGEIIDFDADSQYTPFRSFHLGLRLSPLVGYQLSNQWALTLQPQWAWNPQIGFDNPNLYLTTQQFNLILGLRYSL
jgi:hypothetical protein